MVDQQNNNQVNQPNTNSTNPDLSQNNSIPRIENLDEIELSADVLALIPMDSINLYKIVPLNIKDGILEVGIVDPDNLDAISALNFIARKEGFAYKLHQISLEDFNKILQRYSGLGGEIKEALSEFQQDLSEEQQRMQKALDESARDSATGGLIREDAPVIKIVASILRHAVEGGASDIHIEPMEKQTKIRYRVDGVLHTSLKLPATIHQSLVARIKVLSSMRLDERRKPQDGRFSVKILGRKIDFRVSTFPTYYGEKVVMRILDREKGFVPMDQLGLSEKNFKVLKSAIVKPHGLILISGPTGSGKTTTLYSILNELDRETKNILSLEDPVEYHMEGVNQSQVRPEIGYTFANGLRTTLRQDPDIIMVGEIRDGETAKLAIQAALTGHLVLSTIHTNSAVGVVPRLVDMGVEPYLIAPTLILAIAQRLVRKFCPDAKQEVKLSIAQRALIEKEFADLPPEYRPQIPDTVYEPKPTSSCPTGLRGRMAVFEMVPTTRDLEAVILKDPSGESVRKVARSQGMYTMREDALMKAFRGEIPYSEVEKLSTGLLIEEATLDEINN